MTRVVAYGPHADQTVEVWDRPGPAVVLVHGGFWREQWDREHARPAAAALAEHGVTVLLPEYRRVPGDPDATVEDVRAALALVPADRDVTLTGHSAGGQLALWAASACPPPRLQRVVGLAPVADLAGSDRLDLGDGAARSFLGSAAEERPDLDPVAMATPGAPVTLVAAEHDDDVPFEVLAAYRRRHPATRILTIPGAGHLDLVDPTSGAWPGVLHELLAAR